MSLMTQAYLMDRYGPWMTEAQLAEVLHLNRKTLANQRCKGELPVKPAKVGSRVVWHAADVAEYLDSVRAAVRP